MVERRCVRCGTPFTTYPSLDKRYCGRDCYHAARRLEGDAYQATYRMVTVTHGHPLATARNRRIPEHRLLLWEKIGPGPHRCHRCGRWVNWSPGAGTAAGSLVVDHRDRDKHNNDPSNLVPSCQSCNNRNRLDGVRDDERHRIAAAGHRVRCETRQCESCGADFLRWPDKNPRKGRFCSRSCARRGDWAARRAAT